ncbi:MAG: hypothetical protein KDC98_04690 [Planctomycetes bacterium]|nr:hypothetical protein [Planctomycetota bacterium]
MLSHHLIDEAAETLFVPVAIKNNTKGDDDEKVLVHFAEKAWNNPVVRFLAADEKALAPRLHEDWSVAAMATGMVTALRGGGHEVPEWLSLLAAEELARRRGLERAVFSQA